MVERDRSRHRIRVRAGLRLGQATLVHNRAFKRFHAEGFARPRRSGEPEHQTHHQRRREQSDDKARQISGGRHRRTDLGFFRCLLYFFLTRVSQLSRFFFGCFLHAFNPLASCWARVNGLALASGLNAVLWSPAKVVLEGASNAGEGATGPRQPSPVQPANGDGFCAAIPPSTRASYRSSFSS